MKSEQELVETATANAAFAAWLHKHGPDEDTWEGYTVSLQFRYNGARYWTTEFRMRTGVRETHVYEHSQHGVGFVRILAEV
jgi:hypothetical protein